MSFEVYFNFDQFAQYAIDHSTGQTITVIDYSCQICYPKPAIVSQPFTNFWNWYSTEHKEIDYTRYTTTAFGVFRQKVQLLAPTYIIVPREVPILAARLFYSVTYSEYPKELVDHLVSLLCNLAARTDHFNNPVTAPILQRATEL